MNGLLLINLGTPEAPTTSAVRRYLREFLSDPRVIDINPIGRFLLLNLIILPFRPAKSAAAYRQIWTDRGSPLLYHTLDLADQMRERLGTGWHIEVAMRYGQPSLAAALERLCQAGVARIVVAPLFPHYAGSSTGSALEAVFQEAGKLWNVPPLSVIESFYDDPGFIDAFAAVGKSTLVEEQKVDHVLFSFHGLPERQVQRSDDTGSHCLAKQDCCDRIVPANRNCYRAQCFATARLLAQALEIDDAGYTVTFQSRLGRTPWIQPYTDDVIDQLAAAGTKRLAVFCPAFVADCLETLEEIGMRAKEQFQAAGGDELILVPSLNSSPAWSDALVALLDRHANSLGIRPTDGAHAGQDTTASPATDSQAALAKG